IDQRHTSPNLPAELLQALELLGGEKLLETSLGVGRRKPTSQQLLPKFLGIRHLGLGCFDLFADSWGDREQADRSGGAEVFVTRARGRRGSGEYEDEGQEEPGKERHEQPPRGRE